MNLAQNRFTQTRSILLSLSSTILLLFGLLWAFQAQSVQSLHAQQSRLAATSPQLLAIYALAFDNAADSPGNLSNYYTSTVQSIVSATAATPERVAVILIDLDDYGDTHIIIAQNGVTVPVEGLPNSFSLNQPVTLDTNVTEYDMSNGWYLGNFIRWARQLYPISNTIFSFVGHGAPLTPQLQPLTERLPSAEGTTTPTPAATPFPPSEFEPLPPRWGAHADFTDYHSASLISVRSLAQALNIGTADGNDPLMVVDLLHCFSATIEELYEVHPYARTIIAAPNYSYAQPSMLGETLARLDLASFDPAQSPSALAKAIVTSYDQLLPSDEHPRLFIAVDADKIAPIKAAWDQTASELLSEFASDESTARTQLLAAYQASAKYDTTLCQPQDWQLAPPDALSDMADFASQLRTQFGAQSAVGTWSMTTTQTISDAIIARYSHDGSPWFATIEPAPLWKFPAAGIALFTDFAPQTVDGLPQFSWQAAWYTYTVSNGNPHPYSFIQPSVGIRATWADLFSRFWTEPITSTTGCIQGFVSGRGAGELRIVGLSLVTESVSSPIFFSTTVQSAAAATNPLLRFRVYRNGATTYEEVVGTGYLGATVTRTVQSKASWSPQLSGVYAIEAMLDVDNRFEEENENDNVITVTVTIDVLNRVFLPVVER